MARTIDYERRREVTRGAFEVVRQRGPQNVTMSHIAAGLGMKRSSLYWYFRDLGQVFEGVLEDLLMSQTLYLRDRMLGLSAPVDLLIAWLDGVVGFHRRRPADLELMFRLWAASSGGNTETVLRATHLSDKALRAWLTTALSDGIAAGTVRPCDPPLITTLTGITIDGLLVHMVARGTDPTPARDHFVASVLRPLELHP